MRLAFVTPLKGMDVIAVVWYDMNRVFRNFVLSGDYMKVQGIYGKSSRTGQPAKKRKAACIAMCVVSACLLSACKAKTDTAIIIAGSTSVQPFAELLAEEYAHLHPDHEVDIQGGGSSAGITAAESGIADIGMSSRALKEAEQGLLLSAFAYQK